MDKKYLEEDFRYEAFISYRHVEPDMSVAKSLHRHLERFAIPPSVRENRRKKIGKVFRDQEELPNSPDLKRSIEIALEESKWLIVVATPRLLESKWCMREVDFFIELGRKDRILILLVEGEPDTSFPPQLRFANIDGQQVEIEPLAADVRDRALGGMKKKLGREKLRLLAPMLGVSFDDLFRRAHKYFVRKVACIAAASMLVLGGFGGAVTYQILETQKAQRAAASENIAQLTATAQRYLRDNQQPEAVRAAQEALRLSEEYNLDSTAVSTTLYNALAMYSYRAPYAKLSHTSEVNALRFSPDGSRISTLSDERIITVWDTATAKKCYEVSFQLSYQRGAMTSFPDTSDNMVNLSDWTFRMDFTEENELVVLFLDEGRVLKYDDAGNVIFDLTLEDISGEGEYFSQELVVFDAAEVIFLASLKTNYFLDIHDGTILDEFESSALFYAALSQDKESLGILCENRTYKIYRASDMMDAKNPRQMEETGDLAPEYSGLFQTYNGYYGLRYLFDDYFLFGDVKTGFYVFDASEETLVPIPGIGAYDTETNPKPVILLGAENGSFVVGYSNTVLMKYRFDPVAGTVTELERYLNTASYGTVQRYGWAQKEEGVLVVDTNGDGSISRMVRDPEWIYQYTALNVTSRKRLWDRTMGFCRVDYDENDETQLRVFLPEVFACSETGLLAEIFESADNVVSLTNVRAYPNPHAVSSSTNTTSDVPPYMNIEKGIGITNRYDSEGSYFEIFRIDSENAYSEPRKVYLPDTAGYAPFDDRQIVDECEYGEDYAVIIRGHGEFDPENDEEATSVYILDYETAELRTLIDKTYASYSVIAITKDGVVLQKNLAYCTFYDPYTMEPAPDPIPLDWTYQRKNEKRNLWVCYSGPYEKNIILSSYIDLEEMVIKVGIQDFDKKEMLFTGEDIRAVDGVLWSSDGDRFFTYTEQDAVHAFSYKDEVRFEKTMEIDGLPVAVMAHKGDILSVQTGKNHVEFYNMHSLEKLYTATGIHDAVQSVTYNQENGWAVISTKKSCYIYDVRAGVPVMGEITFPEFDYPITEATVYIANDMEALFFVYMDVSIDKPAGGTVSCYLFDCVKLMNAEELLRLA